MPILVTCSKCNQGFQVHDDHAGRRGRCSKCGAVVQVPRLESASVPTPTASRSATEGSTRPVSRSLRAAEPAAPASASPASAPSLESLDPSARLDRLVEAFRGEITPAPVTGLYRLGIVVVTAAMILLPLIYVSLIALVGYGLFYHATHSYVVFTGGGTRSTRGAVVVYFGPLIAGSVLIAFMIKPLFARAPRAEANRALDPEKETLLFAFVDHLCAVVGAPSPERIEVDCQVNASARREGGFLSLIGGSFVLTIGLPLVAGLSLRQFAGVLAHEFGHFSQGAGMRLTFLIRAISLWFLRVVYERDSWDQRLAGMARSSEIAIMVFARITQLLVWLTRRVLWLLMQGGQLISCFMLRQMEFDADRYEARMVGSDVFQSTVQRLRLLSAAERGARTDLAAGWDEGRLADNLPVLIALNVSQIPDEVKKALDENLTSTKTGLFDTHPSDIDRIESAHREEAPGIFRLKGNAAVLFRDFDKTAKAATFAYYREIFGPSVAKERLFPVESLFRTQEAVYEGNKAISRFFLNGFSPFRPLPFPDTAPPRASEATLLVKSLTEARNAMFKMHLQAAEDLKHRAEIEERLASHGALGLLRAARTKARVKPSTFGLDDEDALFDGSVEREAMVEARAIGDSLRPFERMAAQRILSALRLFDSPALPRPIADSGLARQEIERLYPTLVYLGSVLPGIPPLLRTHRSLAAILQRFEGHEEDQGWHRAVIQGATHLRESLEDLTMKLGNRHPYPFDHAERGITIAAYAVPGIPDAREVSELLQAAGAAGEKLIVLYARVLGRLVLAAEQVEAVLGLPELLSAVKRS